MNIEYFDKYFSDDSATFPDDFDLDQLNEDALQDFLDNTTPTTNVVFGQQLIPNQNSLFPQTQQQSVDNVQIINVVEEDSDFCIFYDLGNFPTGGAINVSQLASSNNSFIASVQINLNVIKITVVPPATTATNAGTVSSTLLSLSVESSVGSASNTSFQLYEINYTHNDIVFDAPVQTFDPAVNFLPVRTTMVSAVDETLGTYGYRAGGTNNVVSNPQFGTNVPIIIMEFPFYYDQNAALTQYSSSGLELSHFFRMDFDDIGFQPNPPATYEWNFDGIDPIYNAGSTINNTFKQRAIVFTNQNPAIDLYLHLDQLVDGQFYKCTLTLTNYPNISNVRWRSNLFSYTTLDFPVNQAVIQPALGSFSNVLQGPFNEGYEYNGATGNVFDVYRIPTVGKLIASIVVCGTGDLRIRALGLPDQDFVLPEQRVGQDTGIAVFPQNYWDETTEPGFVRLQIGRYPGRSGQVRLIQVVRQT
jgi:hypothetical protein